MPYTIAIFPKFTGLNKINSIRRKYDPNYKLLKPHIALVYYFKKKPVDEKLNEVKHMFSSFEVKLSGIRVSSKNNYLFLDVTYGREKMIKLKEILYKKLGLKWDKDFSYVPHITLAKFKTKTTQKTALNEIKKEEFDFSCKISSFILLESSDDLRALKQIKKYTFP